MVGLNLNFDVSLLFPLAISLLIGGALFYYFYTRINVLETSIINQGKILQTFISGNINTQTAGSTTDTLNNNNNNNNLQTELSQKIDISDDEESDDDDDDDNDDDEEDDNENKQNLNLQDNEDNDDDDDDEDEEDTKLSKQELIIQNENINNPREMNVVNLGPDLGVPTMEILANILQMNPDETIINSGVNGNNLTLEETDIIKVIDMNSTNLEEISNEQGVSEDFKKKNKSLNKMNVKELQEYVSKKGLNINTDTSKLKKAELLELISKEISNGN